MKVPIKVFMAGFMMVHVAACSDSARLPEESTFGPNPILPEPNETLIPTVNIAPAKGWPADAKPIAASGLSVSAYATGLDHPRWLYVLPNGDVLVAETNGPPRPEDGRGIRGWIYQLVQSWVGAGVPSANRITLLRDADGDGVAEIRSIFIQDSNSPFGMALIGHDLYVANTDAVMRFSYADGDTVIRGPGVKVCDLPAGPLNHHWTKNLIAGLDGKHLYVAVGSNSNAAENGLDKEDRRASILEIDVSNGQSRVFASGLRNPVGMAWEAETGALWTVVNERDELGSYRKPLSGYKVIFVPFADGRPVGKPLDVLTGFVSADNEAHGRPVGVAIDRAGALLVADDVGNRVWRVAPASPNAKTIQ